MCTSTDAYVRACVAKPICPCAVGGLLTCSRQNRYASARCVNGAGLSAAFSTDGAFFELTQPSERGAFIEIVSPPALHKWDFPIANGHQTVDDAVRFRWQGFTVDKRQIDHYEARLVGPGVSTNWTNTRLRQQMEITGLALKESTLYKVQVVLANAAGEKTTPIETGVWVDTSPPRATGVRLCGNWTSTGLYLAWADSFAEDGCAPVVTGSKADNTNPHCLRYHYNVGIGRGSADVLKWKTSVLKSHVARAFLPNAILAKAKSKDDTDVEFVDQTVNYIVVVAAHNLAGKATTRTFELEGAPTCPAAADQAV